MVIYLFGPGQPGWDGWCLVTATGAIKAKKNKTISYDALASVNFPALALVGDRLVR